MLGISRLQKIYGEYPRQFWLLMFGVFIDRTGGALLFPFFSLYITRHFDVGLTEAGIVFLIFSVTGLFGSTVGGALTDRLGRKQVVIFGLIVSALSSLTMAAIDQIFLFYVVAAIVGLFSNVGGPAQQAMVADLLDEEQRAEGYGVWRIIVNVAIAFGPLLGGLLVAYAFVWLFIADAVTSLITAGILATHLRETYQPQSEKAQKAREESLATTFRGYLTVFKDSHYLAFIAVSTLMGIVYIQMYGPLSVFLRDYRGFPEQGYGYLISVNATLVVLTQFWITRRLRGYAPLLMMALANILYAVGYGLYGFIQAVPLFFLAMIVITVGEMVAMPVAQALVAKFAPEEMRGRYMAVFGLSWAIPHGLGPLMAGYVMDNYNPDIFWFMMGGTAIVATLGFVYLHQTTHISATEEVKHIPLTPEAMVNELSV